MKQTNQIPHSYVLVASGNQALSKSGNINTTSNAVNISAGQLGVIVDKKTLHLNWGDFLGTTNNPAGTGPNTAQDVPSVKFVQGTPASADTSNLSGWPDEHKPFVESDPILLNQIRSVTYAKPVIGTMPAFLASFPTVLEESTYGLWIQYRGTRTDRSYGQNVEESFVSFETPVTLPGQPQDLVNQNIAHQINLLSNKVKGNQNVIALGINTAGSTGQALGTITSATSVPFFTTGGVTYSTTFNRNLIQTLKAAVDNTALTNTSTIEVINIATAGSTAKVDTILIIGLDEVPARAYSGISQRRSRIDISVDGGTKTVASRSREDEGQGYQLIIKYNESAFYNSGTNELANHSDFVLRTPQYIDPNMLYTVCTINYFDTDMKTAHNAYPIYEKQLEILIPATDTSGTATVSAGVVTSTNAATTITDLEAIVKPYLKSHVGVEYIGDQTASVIFS